MDQGAKTKRAPPASLTIEIPVSCSLGAMGPLLRRLRSLLYTDQCLPQGVSKDELQGFVEDLEAISAPAMDLSALADTSFTDKCWMKEVREICYDTEDYLDMVLQLHSGAGVPNIPWMKQHRWRLKIPWIQAKLKQQRRPIKIPWIRTKEKHQHPRHLIAKDISELWSRLQSARSQRPQSAAAGVKTIAKPIPVPLGPLLDTPYAGLGKKVTEVVSLLALDTEQQLKTVPIVGHPGAGKTALAKTLYQKFGLRFHCRAFLRVSRNPDSRRLLASLLSQVKGPQPRRGMCDLQDLIASIRKHLQDKSYFIVVDDLWGTSVWDIIRRAFPEGSCCSRIITTTEVEDVALACSAYHSKGIFKMVPLNDDQSRQLFFCRVFVSEDVCLDQDFNEMSHGTIPKSRGLPLAIIYIASLLASWPSLVLEQKKYIEDCLHSALRPNVPSERMKELLNLIYNNLPCHLKTCLIYLNMYPEGYVIQKDDLVRQWVAESFLNAAEGKDDEQVAGEYFDELVARGLIQPVDTSHNTQVLSCTVHHMVFDLIAYECKEENFITVLDYFDIHTGISDKVRRLSIKLGGAKSAQIQGSFRMSQARSLLFSGFFKCIPCIEEFRFLRVLILYIWSDQRKAKLDLAIIRKLIQLRYLKIECNMAVELPAKIQGLQQLMALEVDAIVATVPSDVVHLQCLLHLHLPSAAEVPRGIGLLTSLRSLGHFNLSTSSRHNVLDLSKLTNVQDLHLTCSAVPSKRLIRNMECLDSVLGKISKLKSLVLDGGSSSCKSISCDGLSGVSPPPVLLETLELSPHICIISSLPWWIQELRNLQILRIALRNLSSDDVNILKKLPVLVALSLYVRTGNPSERIMFNKEGFSVLKHFKLVSTSPCVAFTEGAMNTVRRLKLGFNADTMEQYSPLDAGFKHLTSLEVFSAKIGCAGTDEASKNAIQSSLQVAFTEHPSPPIINIQLVDCWIFHGDMETTSAVQRRKHHTTEKGSSEVPNKQNFSRIDISSECSTGMQHPKSYSHIMKQDSLDHLLNQRNGNEIKPEEEYYHSTKEDNLVVNEDYNEQHEIQEIGSKEDSRIQIDSRTSMVAESSLRIQNPDMEMRRQHEGHQSAQKHDNMVEEEPKAPYKFDEKNLEVDTKKRSFISKKEKKRSYGRVRKAQEFSPPQNAAIQDHVWANMDRSGDQPSSCDLAAVDHVLANGHKPGKAVASSVYRAKIAGLSRVVTVSWSRDLLSHAFAFAVAISGADGPAAECRVELRRWLLWRRAGSRCIELGGGPETVRVLWDLRRARFAGGAPEPRGGYFLALEAAGKVVLVQGDLRRDVAAEAEFEAVPVARREHVFGRRRFAAKARFHDKGDVHNVVIECGGGGGIDANDMEMTIAIDGEEVVQVKHLQWKFRGNLSLTFRREKVEVYWDVHDWLFRAGTRPALFVFRPIVLSSTPGLLDGTEATTGCCLYLYAWKLD